MSGEADTTRARKTAFKQCRSRPLICAKSPENRPFPYAAPTRKGGYPRPAGKSKNHAYRTACVQPEGKRRGGREINGPFGIGERFFPVSQGGGVRTPERRPQTKAEGQQFLKTLRIWLVFFSFYYIIIKWVVCFLPGREPARKPREIRALARKRFMCQKYLIKGESGVVLPGIKFFHALSLRGGRAFDASKGKL